MIKYEFDAEILQSDEVRAGAFVYLRFVSLRYNGVFRQKEHDKN